MKQIGFTYIWVNLNAHDKDRYYVGSAGANFRTSDYIGSGNVFIKEALRHGLDAFIRVVCYEGYHFRYIENGIQRALDTGKNKLFMNSYSFTPLSNKKHRCDTPDHNNLFWHDALIEGLCQRIKSAAFCELDHCPLANPDRAISALRMSQITKDTIAHNVSTKRRGKTESDILPGKYHNMDFMDILSKIQKNGIGELEAKRLAMHHYDQLNSLS